MIFSVVIWSINEEDAITLVSKYFESLGLDQEIENKTEFTEIRGYIFIDTDNEFQYWESINNWLVSNHASFAALHKYGISSKYISAFFRHGQKYDMDTFVQFARNNIESLIIKLHNIDNLPPHRPRGHWNSFIGVA